MTDVISAAPLLRLWQRCRRIPGGTWWFSRMLGRRVPYSGTIRARVEDLAPGRARLRMPDRGMLRNHLSSIHAIALTNLGELASGLAMTAAMPADLRGIPTELKIEFVKKARGEILADGSSPILESGQEGHFEAQAIMKDLAGDRVAILNARWVVSKRT